MGGSGGAAARRIITSHPAGADQYEGRGDGKIKPYAGEEHFEASNRFLGAPMATRCNVVRNM